MYQGFETIKELSERWKVPVSWLYGKTRETGPDAIPRVRVGKYIRFITQDVDSWLAGRNRDAARR